jgi:8-oxo-dGTP diphosphatase
LIVESVIKYNLSAVSTRIRLFSTGALLYEGSPATRSEGEAQMTEPLPRVGSALLVRDTANRILLGQRNKDPQRGSWVIPGGKIHAFESIAEAAARELQEETGLQVEVEGQFRVYEIVNPPNEHRLIIYSWARAREGSPKASDDLSQVRFFCPQELDDLQLSPLVRQVLEDAGLIRARVCAALQNA